MKVTASRIIIPVTITRVMVHAMHPHFSACDAPTFQCMRCTHISVHAMHPHFSACDAPETQGMQCTRVKV